MCKDCKYADNVDSFYKGKKNTKFCTNEKSDKLYEFVPCDFVCDEYESREEGEQ